MSQIFKIITQEKGEREEKGICIGIDIQIAGREIPCPISVVCRTVEALSSEAAKIEDDLKRVLEEAKGLMAGPPGGEKGGFSPDMSPEEIWSALVEIRNDDTFIDRFNGLEEEKRREVAEYVLTQCSIFSGRPSLFAARYDASSGLME